MKLPRLKVSWKAVAMNLVVAASLLIGAPAFGQSQADVVEPGSKTKWRLRVETGGTDIAIYTLATGKPKFVGLVTSKNKPQAVQQMDKLLETARTAAFRKVTGPHKEDVAQGAGPLSIRFEVNEGVQSASISGARLTMADARALRDLIWRLESFTGQIRR